MRTLRTEGSNRGKGSIRTVATIGTIAFVSIAPLMGGCGNSGDHHLSKADSIAIRSISGLAENLRYMKENARIERTKDSLMERIVECQREKDSIVVKTDSINASIDADSVGFRAGKVSGEKMRHDMEAANSTLKSLKMKLEQTCGKILKIRDGVNKLGDEAKALATKVDSLNRQVERDAKEVQKLKGSGIRPGAI